MQYLLSNLKWCMDLVLACIIHEYIGLYLSKMWSLEMKKIQIPVSETALRIHICPQSKIQITKKQN